MIPCVYLELSTYQDDDYYLEVAVQDSNNNPVNITGATIAFRGRINESDTQDYFFHRSWNRDCDN